MANSPQLHHLHFILIPLMSPGHLLPMVDMAKVLAHHGVTVTIVTTPLNTIRFKSTVDRAVQTGLRIRLLQLDFPAAAAGLPPGCENMDSLPTRDSIRNFFSASKMLQEPLEKAVEEMEPPPGCIISGKNLAWTVDTAKRLGIPRIFFDGMGCFSFSCVHNLLVSGAHKGVESKFEAFVVPGLAHRVKLNRAQLPESLNPRLTDLDEVRTQMVAAESVADGIVVNTFEELEAEYVKEYKRVKGGKVWCVGPVSLSNQLSQDRAERGLLGSVSEGECVKWLDGQKPRSVVYACLGSICGLTGPQLVELGLGLEASKRPFIWVIREGERSRVLEKWIEEYGFEERIKDRGLLIRGWAPQLLLLAHWAIGGFLTHCGWNSTLEGVSAGVPIICCPLFAEQFINEKLVVDVLGIGVSVGVKAAVTWGLEEKFGLVMRRKNVKEAVEKAMDEGEAGKERRRKARELGESAKRALEEGGSSYLNMKIMIQDVLQWSTNCRN